MDYETTYPDYPNWLGWAILIGFFVGAFGLGTAAFLTADDSFLFSAGDQAMFGAVVGAIGGIVAGFLAWAIAALVVLFRRVARRLGAGHQVA